MEAMDHGCLSSAFVSVLINGSSCNEFQIAKGVRQGDLLAPFPFIIAAEAFNVAMKEARIRGVFHGLHLPNFGPIISHMQFADDTVVLGEWSASNIANIICILHCFYLSSGLKINPTKSTLLRVGVETDEVARYANKFFYKAGSFPIKYLGLPIGVSMNKGESWGPMIDKFLAKLSNWKAKSLSIGGRLTLIKSVLGINEKKVAWISWSVILNKKSNGGLGVGSLKALNLALLSKWLWRFKTEHEALWKKVIQAIHRSNGGIVGVNSTGKYPGTWCNILKVMDKVNIPLDSWFQIQHHPDSLIERVSWVLEDPREFTVSSLRKAFDDLYLKKVPFGSFFWCKWVPSKICLNAWKIAHVRMPTKVNLCRRGVVLLSLSCPLCGEADETKDHIFIQCSVTKRILADFCKWWGIDCFAFQNVYHLLMSGFSLNLKGRKQKAYMGAVYTCLWTIWKFGNQKFFPGAYRDKDVLVGSQIQAYSFFWIKHRSNRCFHAYSWPLWIDDSMSCVSS
ncbi:hypothetical protein OSB04_003541 [Centaurea solstitialis]|uniref:Reverse transcriptase domain-containing protein n=1 Tax=Centaurea solstitialis TaxID=347529 RepID=A0AA38WTT5_9ASTR|nr:hypothetical protein OSB04_003541 [Centaurea solstitialis]